MLAGARVVIRAAPVADGDEVGAVSKNGVLKVVGVLGDWVSVSLDTLGLEDDEKTLQSTGAWALARNKVLGLSMEIVDISVFRDEYKQCTSFVSLRRMQLLVVSFPRSRPCNCLVPYH